MPSNVIHRYNIIRHLPNVHKLRNRPTIEYIEEIYDEEEDRYIKTGLVILDDASFREHTKGKKRFKDYIIKGDNEKVN